MSQTHAPVEFILDREEIPVTLKSPKTNSTTEYILREMDGFERDSYLNTQRTKVDRTTQNVRDFLDVQTGLIAMCLYTQSDDKRVDQTDIRKFPAKVQMKLHELCLELNGFDADAETVAKNS